MISMARVVGGNPHLQIAGERQHGIDVRTQNATAVMSIANIVKTSLGPVGLDKVCFAQIPIYITIK